MHLDKDVSFDYSQKKRRLTNEYKCIYSVTLDIDDRGILRIKIYLFLWIFPNR
jgi:hypothetical protein